MKRCFPSPEEIRNLRISRGQTQEELGRTVGISPSAVSHWETGRRQPNPYAADALCRQMSALSRAEARRQAAEERRRQVEEQRRARDEAKRAAAEERERQRDEERRRREAERAKRQAQRESCRVAIRAAAKFPRGYPVQPGCESYDRVCYLTRAHALRAFADVNPHVIQPWGGLLATSDGGEYDAINERYELRGRRRVRTLAEALNAALPPGRPFCLDRLDLDALNETVPGRDYGPFVRPDVVAEHLAYQSYLRGQRQYEEYLHEQDSFGVPVPEVDEEVPF